MHGDVSAHSKCDDSSDHWAAVVLEAQGATLEVVLQLHSQHVDWHAVDFGALLHGCWPELLRRLVRPCQRCS